MRRDEAQLAPRLEWNVTSGGSYTAQGKKGRYRLATEGECFWRLSLNEGDGNYKPLPIGANKGSFGVPTTGQFLAEHYDADLDTDEALRRLYA